MRLERCTTADLHTTRPLLAIPVGSCEQHGPHLPLGTDTIIAAVLAERLADAVDDVCVGPTLSVTSSGEHAGFPGTLSIGAAATELVLVELARSADWAEGIVFVNGHGGNVEPVAAAVATIRSEGRRVHAWWPQLPDGDAHAGRTETSLLLAIEPGLVAVHRAEPGDRRRLAEIAAELRSGGVRAVSPNGVLGDPTTASVADGVRLLDALAADLIDSVQRSREAWKRPAP